MDDVVAKFDSKTEKLFYEDTLAHVVIGRDLSLGDPRVIVPQPLQIAVVSGKYTPDFLIAYGDETYREVIVEIKGYRTQRTLQTSMLKIKEASARFPHWIFIVAARLERKGVPRGWAAASDKFMYRVVARDALPASMEWGDGGWVETIALKDK